jgi:hypothetical protein
MALLLGVNRCESGKNQALSAANFRALFIKVLREVFK